MKCQYCHTKIRNPVSRISYFQDSRRPSVEVYICQRCQIPHIVKTGIIVIPVRKTILFIIFVLVFLYLVGYRVGVIG